MGMKGTTKTEKTSIGHNKKLPLLQTSTLCTQLWNQLGPKAPMFFAAKQPHYGWRIRNIKPMRDVLPSTWGLALNSPPSDSRRTWVTRSTPQGGITPRTSPRYVSGPPAFSSGRVPAAVTYVIIQLGCHGPSSAVNFRVMCRALTFLRHHCGILVQRWTS
jgi:hypothetical protein